jgi:hypothetical protein
MLAGGFHTPKEADEETQSLVNSLLEEIEERLQYKIFDIKVVCYSTQVVAGINYLVKVQVNEEKFAHIKIAKPLPHTHQPPFVMAVATEGIVIDSPLTPLHE